MLQSNDRLFLSKTYCFKTLGHIEPSNEPINVKEIQSKDPKDKHTRKVILGDDLGSERNLTLMGRLEFTDIPWLRDHSIKPFIFGEYVFYPPYSSNNQYKGGLRFME